MWMDCFSCGQIKTVFLSNHEEVFKDIKIKNILFDITNLNSETYKQLSFFWMNANWLQF